MTLGEKDWPRILTWTGVVISISAVVALIWSQAQGPFGGGTGLSLGYRLEIAMGPVETFGVGIVVSIAAQVMGMMQASRRQPGGD